MDHNRTRGNGRKVTMLIDIKRDIKNYRDSLNANQRVFGRRYGKSDKAVSTWESGKSQCPLELFVDVYNYLSGEIRIKLK